MLPGQQRDCVRVVGYSEVIQFDGLSATRRSARSWANSRGTGIWEAAGHSQSDIVWARLPSEG